MEFLRAKKKLNLRNIAGHLGNYCLNDRLGVYRRPLKYIKAFK
ncbi:hypothetical protein [Chryseobacterium sp. BLS98]|nr:hypothetical protein [Chryseobacterium sp. BLS98]